MYVFRVTQHGEPSIVLAAVDEGQYELWHDAFKRAKLLKDQSNEKGEYLSFPDFDDDDEEPDGPYERPEDYIVCYLCSTLFIVNNIKTVYIY